MPKVSPIQGNFNSGEVSPLFFGRVDNPRYQTGVERCQRFLPTIQGGITRMPGTQFVSEVKDSTKKVRLFSFEFSTEQAYILEFGDQYIRFYRNKGQIQVSSVAVELVSPYLEADLFNIHITQSADVLYIVHPNHAPRILNRISNTLWSLEVLEFLDGPYLQKQQTNLNGYLGADAGLTNIQLDPSATSGSISLSVSSGSSYTVTGAANNGSGLIRITLSTTVGTHLKDGASVFIVSVTGTTEANGDWVITNVTSTTFDLVGSTFANAYVSGGSVYMGVFSSTDIGRLVRLKHGSTFGWAKITSYTSSRSVTASVNSNFGADTPVSEWYLGSWSATTGYPSTLTFFEDRLCFAGASATPQRIDMSYSSEYLNFATTDTSANVIATNAISVTLNANDVNAIQWLASDEKGLLVGTTGGEWVVRAAASYEAVTPTNITAKKATSFGCSNIQPVQVGKATLYAQRAKKKVREFSYFYEVDGFKSNDLTILSDHITGTGVVEFAYQKEPYPIVWSIRDDGQLIGVTYERDLDGIRAGWHRHIMGGVSDAASSDAIVESISTIPSSDGSTNELWMVVQRYINGSIKRYVEFVKPVFSSEDPQEDAFFVDAGLTYDAPINISSITKANPGVVTANAHGFSNGDKVVFRKLKGMNELNGKTALVANVTTNTFEITNLSGFDIDTTNYSSYVSSGQVRKLVTTISGLSHLEGESVTVLADGAVQPNKTVVSGSITLSEKAATVTIGLGYNSDLKLLRLEAGSADGTALGKTRRIHRMGLLLDRSLGLKFGSSFGSLDTFTFRTTADAMTRAPSLYTGIISFRVEFDYDFENQLCIRQDQPLPLTILAVLPQLITQDR